MKSNTIPRLEQRTQSTSRVARLAAYPASLFAGLALFSLALMPGNIPAAGKPTPQGPQAHVDSVNVVIGTRPALGARHKTRQKYAAATVVILDDFGDFVEGAKVTVEFTGNLLQQPATATGTTDASGKVVLESKSVGYDSGPLSFTGCVTKVESSLAWDGVEVCDTASY